MKILTVAAHPDDEVLGCGGTMAKLAREGHDVFIAILGEGITSRYKNPKEAETEQVDNLHSVSRKVVESLGARDLFMYSLPDNRFDSIDLLDIVKIVEELLESVQPEVIYTHHGGDLNVDHQVVNRAVLTATRPIKGQVVKDIYAFEVASSTEWAFQTFDPVFRPNTFIDISETLETKINAMELYESEARSFPHPRSPAALRAIAERWGTVVGCGATEAFEMIRSIRG